jgi:undecaprenyl-diphosphatase
VVLGGLGVVLALAVSELVKVLVAQDRPRRTVAGLGAVARCPPIGDWSLPSNHATVLTFG